MGVAAEADPLCQPKEAPPGLRAVRSVSIATLTSEVRGLECQQAAGRISQTLPRAALYRPVIVQPSAHSALACAVLCYLQVWRIGGPLFCKKL